MSQMPKHVIAFDYVEHEVLTFGRKEPRYLSSVTVECLCGWGMTHGEVIYAAKSAVNHFRAVRAVSR